MPSLSGMTLAQLKAATAAQIAAAMTPRIAALTKRQLVTLELLVRDYDVNALPQIDDDPVVVRGADGQVVSQVQVQRDALGVKLGSRVVAWTYYAAKGPVNTITTTQLDAADKEASRTVVKRRR
jgi:hypothetical protein